MYLFVFDFDHTLINEDSDHQVASLDQEILAETTLKSRNGGQWTDICHWAVGELHKKGFREKDITDKLKTIAFSASIKDAFELIKGKQHEIIIISDANTVYIEQITKEKMIIDLIDVVITNPAFYDESGRLNIDRHTKGPDSHQCDNKCPANLCKGRELMRFLEKKQYSRVIYVGDGGNDFCPSTKLSATDYIMPRVGYKLHNLITNDPDARIKLKASIKEWESASDLFERLKELLLQKNLIPIQLLSTLLLAIITFSKPVDTAGENPVPHISTAPELPEACGSAPGKEENAGLTINGHFCPPGYPQPGYPYGYPPAPTCQYYDYYSRCCFYGGGYYGRDRCYSRGECWYDQYGRYICY